MIYLYYIIYTNIMNKLDKKLKYLPKLETIYENYNMVQYYRIKNLIHIILKNHYDIVGHNYYLV